MADYTTMNMEFLRHGNAETAVERLLLTLGFQSRLIGTGYLSQAIALKYGDGNLSCSGIYARVADRHATTVASVERAIRHSLNNCRAEGSIHHFNTIVGCKVIDRKFYTTNSEFISVVSRWLRWVRHDDVAKKGI